MHSYHVLVLPTSNIEDEEDQSGTTLSSCHPSRSPLAIHPPFRLDHSMLELSFASTRTAPPAQWTLIISISSWSGSSTGHQPSLLPPPPLKFPFDYDTIRPEEPLAHSSKTFRAIPHQNFIPRTGTSQTTAVSGTALIGHSIMCCKLSLTCTLLGPYLTCIFACCGFPRNVKPSEFDVRNDAVYDTDLQEES